MNKKIHNIYVRPWWFALCLCLLVFLFFPFSLFAEEKKENRYMGSDSCKPCHETQYISFKSYARKSRSFESVRKMKKGLTEDEIKECYACHTMGYGKPGGFISPEKTPELKNAGCEVCHGPGKIHIETEDPAYIIRNVTINICQGCHIEERVQAFRYKPIIYAGSH
jgi:hypothetical protein